MTDLKMPGAMAELRPSLGEIVVEGQKSAPYFSVLLTSKTGLRIQVNNREERVTEPDQPPTAGTVLTAFDGITTQERAAGGFSADTVRRAARELVQGGGFAKLDRGPQPERRGDYATAIQIDPMELSVQQKLDRVRSLHRRTKDRNNRITNVVVTYREYNQHAVFADETADLAQRVQRVSTYLMVFVSGSDGKTRYDWLGKAGTGGWELLEYTDEEIQGVVDRAIALLSAERIEPGEYEVITAPGVSGTICHESFGHGVETDMFLKQRARAAHFINKRVGSDLVNIFDDPSYARGFGSYFFDDEGKVAGPTRIVEAGIFRQGISDMYSAHALGMPRSANGRRQDYGRKAYARMSNTFFGEGTSTLEDMLAQVDRGVYLDKWYSGMEDPQGWGIQVSCHYGHEIKGGKITERVFAPIGISGYVPDVLQSIRAASKGISLDGGHCGKGHKELVQVASGGPHLLMRARLG